MCGTALPLPPRVSAAAPGQGWLWAQAGLSHEG